MRWISFIPLIWMPQLLAQEAAVGAATVDPVSSSYLLKLSGGLVLIIMLVLGLAWLLRRLHLVQNTNNGLIRIVSAIPVGQRERIALLQVGEEQILIGLSSGKIEKLHTLKKPLQLATEPEPQANSFQQKLEQLIKKGQSNA